MNRDILKLAIPNILSNISIPLVTSVDTALMGHLNSASLAALGAMGMVFMVLYGAFNFLRSGTTGITAQAFGMQNVKLISNTLWRALFIAAALGLAAILAKEYILNISISLMNIQNSFLKPAVDYFNIRIFTAPAIFLTYALVGWFFGMQNALYPLIITLILNLLNIIFSYYFVYIENMGIKGAAYGTLISQYAALFSGFFILLKYKAYLYKPKLKEILIKNELARFFRINRDIFIRTLALTFAFAFLYSKASSYSQQALSVTVLLLQFIIWFAYSIDGFANASESLVGKYYGKKDMPNLLKAVKYSLMWSFGVSFAYFLIYFIFGEEILHLLTNQQNLIYAASGFLPLMAFVPFISFLAFIWDGIFIGLTAAKEMRNTILLSLTLFILGFYLTKNLNYLYSLWVNFLLFLLYRGVIQSALFFFGKMLKRY